MAVVMRGILDCRSPIFDCRLENSVSTRRAEVHFWLHLNVIDPEARANLHSDSVAHLLQSAIENRQSKIP
jgi:hypothetical protein